MNILIYNPANSAAKDIEALSEAYILKGHKMYLLTQSPEGILHVNIKNNGGQSFSNNVNSKLSYFAHIYYLINFCNKYNIDIVYSNLQQCSKISIFGQYFVKAKFIAYRHHSDSVQLFGNWKEKLIDYLINKLAKNIIVISEYSYNQIVNVEKVNPIKISKIPLGYNFNNFQKPLLTNVNGIKNKYSAKLMLVIVGRLIPLKRVDVAINAIYELVKKGFDVKLMIVGSGELEEKLKKQIIDKNLLNHVYLIGHVNNVEDYLAASDLLIHTSSSEASCHMPKEAGILGKTVIVCENVGDFSDYIISGFNGLLISKENVYEDLISTIINVYEKKIDIFKFGNQLKSTIEERFDINCVINEHERLINK